MTRKLVFVLNVFFLLCISLPLSAQNIDKFSIQGYLGGTLPVSTFTERQTGETSWGVIAGYDITPNTTVIVNFAYNRFSPHEFFEMPSDFHFVYRTTQFTAGVKQNLYTADSFIFYTKAQTGLYNTGTSYGTLAKSPKEETSLGINGGLGAMLKYDKHFGVFAETTAHNVFADENISFVILQGGISFNF